MLKIKNKKGDGLTWMGEHVGALVLTVLVSFFIIYLIGLLFFSAKGESDVTKIESELDILYSTVESGQSSYLLTGFNGWDYIFSYEFSDFCDGDFCLCACNEEDCSDLRACVPTSSFVSLRDEGKTVRVVDLDSERPVFFDLSILREGDVYPFTESVSLKRFLSEDLVDQPLTIFHRYNSEKKRWEWTRNFVVWFPASDSERVDSELKGDEYVNDRSLIKSLGGKNFNIGRGLLSKGTVSREIYVIDKPKQKDGKRV